MVESSRLKPNSSFLILIDILIIFVSFYLTFIIGAITFQKDYLLTEFEFYYPILFFYIPSYILISYFVGVYHFASKFLMTVIKIGITCIAILGATVLFIQLLNFDHNEKVIILLVTIQFVITNIYRFITLTFYTKIRKIRKYDERILIIGNYEEANELYEYFKVNRILGMYVIGFVKVDNDIRIDPNKIVGSIDEIEHLVVKHQIDEVIFCLPRDYIGQVEKYVLDCEQMGITVNIILSLYDIKLSKSTIETMGHFPMMTYHTVSLDKRQLYIKKSLDIIGAIVGLIITLIVGIFVSLFIMIEDGFPIFFKQDRVGKSGRIFTCYKFRSMYRDAELRKKDLMVMNEMNGHMFKIKDDPRITKVGKFLRKTSLDELPQFFNVLKGDMSLVGTRPPTVDEVSSYERHHRRRISIKPGITGMWQISGRNHVNDFEKVVELDTWYIDHYSIWLDIKIILKTVLVVFKRNGSR